MEGGDERESNKEREAGIQPRERERFAGERVTGRERELQEKALVGDRATAMEELSSMSCAKP
ncbi:hypothetical protein TIFTF001_041372 [Ficus carica]|uniref:Uncharacterized protein n=1 Tax=Ficus carica TaxID=3494 RepID=A0AA87ZV39_FICCA|nr:hypothetical protein TIFTF001_041372 [Ficus carica]